MSSDRMDFQPYTKNFPNVSISGGEVQLGDRYVNIYQYPDPEHQAWLQFLSSLRYPEMKARFNEISAANSQTFQWIFETTNPHYWDRSLFDERQRFQQWIKTGNGNFLLQGKPGSGKSTFMKFVFEHERTLALLQEWSSSRPVHMLFHGFWLAGSKLQTNLRGCLANLLFQLVSKEQRLVKSCVTLSAFQNCLADWSLEDLMLSLKTALQDSSSYKFIFIDGLDELTVTEEYDQLLVLLDAVTKQSNMSKSFLSSRPLPYILHDLRGVPSIVLHHFTDNDINTYVTDTLKLKTNSKIASADDDAKIHRIAAVMCERAEGVFFWVRYVLSNVCKGFVAYDSLDDLLRRVETLPTAVEDLYRLMWQSQNQDHHVHAKDTATIFCLGRYFPMSLFQLAISMDREKLDKYLGKLETLDTTSLALYCGEFNHRLKSRTAGLVESDLKEPQMPWYQARVQYFHRTVHDFMKENEYFVNMMAPAEGRTEYIRKLTTTCDVLWVRSFLALLVQQIGFLEAEWLEELRASQAWNNQECMGLIDIVDEFCAKFWWQHCLGEIAVGGNWVLDCQRASRSWLVFFDYASLMAASTPTSLKHMLRSRGSRWSAYYKGHLAMCCLNHRLRLRDSASALLPKMYEIWDILKEAGADMTSRHPYGSLDQRVAIRSPASLLIMEASLALLPISPYRYWRSWILDHFLGALEGIALPEDDVTLYWGFLNGWMNGLLDDPAVSFTFDVRDLYKALCEVIRPYENDFQLGHHREKAGRHIVDQIQAQFARILSDMPFRMHCATDFQRDAQSCFTFCPYGGEGARSLLRTVLSGGKIYPESYLLILDKEPVTPDIKDLDHSIHWDQIYDYILALDPEQEVLPHEWKEKGVLREYYAQQTNDTEYDSE